MKTDPLTPDLLYNMDAYWRAANYLSVGQIYLYDNPLLRRPLALADVKHMLLGHWGTTPGQNFVYADRQGNIGYQMTGNVPIRSRGDGAVPVPGTGEYEWTGYIPFDKLPSRFNPQDGFIVTANNAVISNVTCSGAEI